jgi:EmrB/QacA subfamily drug resistance transporter
VRHPPHNRWWVLAASALGAFAATAMATGVNVVLPTLTETFDAPFATVQWVVLGYLMASIALLPIVARLADTVGKHKVYFVAYALFALGSLLCAVAPSIGSLIAMRTLQGLGSAGLAAIGLALVTDAFPAAERGRAIGVNGAVISAGIVLGPSLGGLVADALSWRWVFVGGVVVSLLGFLLASRVVPRYAAQRGQRFDAAGAALVFVALLALSLALTLGQTIGFAAPAVLALFASATVAATLFVRVERRVASPVLDLRLFRSRDLTIGLASGLTTFVAISGVIFLMPFYLAGVRGFSPAEIGILMAIVPIVLVVMAPLSGMASDRFGERPVTLVGMVSIFIGYLAVGTLDEHTSSLGYVLRFLPVGIGMGIFQTSNNSAIMGSVPRESSGVGGGLLSLTRYLGQVLGTAVLGSIWAARTVAWAGAPTGSDATSLAVSHQVAALHDVLTIVQFGILAGLALVAWEWWRRRAEARGAESWSGPR